MERVVFSILNSGIVEEVSFRRETVEGVFVPLLQHLAELRQERGRRILVMLAAPPGAGKTTMASVLGILAKEVLPEMHFSVIGMDGFHRYQDYLLSHTMVRDGEEILMVKVKGAPETFDLPLFAERVRRVAAGENCGWPVYDRLLHNPVEDALTVKGDIVLLEGNYLLLNWDGWKELREYADYTIRIMADEEMLRERLVNRKMSTGVGLMEAEAFVDFSDMYNVRTCLHDSTEADMTLCVQTDGDVR